MSTPQPSDKDLDEQVQGLPLTGFPLPHLRTFVLEVRDAARARQFIGKLVEEKDVLNFGGKGPGMTSAVSVGFTYEGLRTLGTPVRILEVLKDKSPAFGEGAQLRASRYLGDTGVSAPDRWKPAFHGQRAHVWIAIHGKTEVVLQSREDLLRGLAGAKQGLAGWDGTVRVPDAAHMTEDFTYADGKPRSISVVHFGFRDNITKPSILDGQRRPAPAPPESGDPVKPQPGELLVGYFNNARADVWTANGVDANLVAFLRNASFGVLRQIQQFEDAFHEYLDTQSDALQRQGYDFVTPEYLQAKLCGRWRNGAPLMPHEVAPAPDWDGDDAPFDFSQDKDGTGCPFGAHVRRANPRSDLMPERDRTVFRRGMPYGERYPGKPDNVERGLIGMFFCGRIDDQFEMLVSEWLEKNPLGPANKGRAKDPFTGIHDEPEAGFHIPLNGGRGILLKDFRTFVRTRGTLYAFLPSRRALQLIASGKHGGGS